MTKLLSFPEEVVEVYKVLYKIIHKSDIPPVNVDGEYAINNIPYLVHEYKIGNNFLRRINCVFGFSLRPRRKVNTDSDFSRWYAENYSTEERQKIEELIDILDKWYEEWYQSLE